MSQCLQPRRRVSVSRSRGLQRLIAGAAVTGAVLAMAACSSQQAPAASGGSPSSPAASPTPAASSSPAGMTLTGAQLDSALAPASSFSGFAANTRDAYQTGTGTAALSSQYNLATMSCTSFSAQTQAATLLGQTAIAWAQFDSKAYVVQKYDEFIYQFASSSAAGSFIQELRSAFSRCQSYSDIQTGLTVRTKYSVADVAPVDGGQAMQVTETATSNAGTMSGELLYVLSGNEVYGVVAISYEVPVPASPSASSLIQGMMTQVQDMNS